MHIVLPFALVGGCKTLRKVTLVASLVAFATTSACADAPGDDDPVASTEQGVQASPDLSVLFTTPKGDGKDDHTIEDAMLDLLSKAAPGSNVRVSIYSWRRDNVAQAFVAASKRKVDVRVVLDGDENKDGADYNSAVRTLIDGLPSGAVTLCGRGKGACIGDHINHNKFLLFSKLTDGTQNVVVQSSQNFTKGMLGQHNNAIIVRNDAKLYASYFSYFGDLRARRLDLGYDRTLDGEHARTHVFPKASGDTVASILDNVRCKKGKSTVRVAMAFFTAERSDIADRLVGLHNRGCDVRIAMRKADDGPVDASIIHTLRRGGVDVGLYPSENGNNIHSKYLLIDAPYEGGGGVERRTLVFTGSHNYTGTALRHNDETLMRVDDAAIYAAFAANWTTIRSQTR